MILRDKQVLTRKPHVCWGCLEMFPAGTLMQYTVSTYPDFVACYHCQTCDKILKNMTDVDEVGKGWVLEFDEVEKQEILNTCPRCHIDLSGVMGYVCPNPNCPTGLGPVMC